MPEELLTVEENLLMLLHAHRQLHGRPAHRVDLEASARVAMFCRNETWFGHTDDDIRGTISVTLLTLRQRGLVDLVEEGFQLTASSDQVLEDLFIQDAQSSRFTSMRLAVCLPWQSWRV